MTALDPTRLGPAEWATVNRALAHLACFVALVIAGALALVLAQGVLPSYAASGADEAEVLESGQVAGEGSTALLRRLLLGTLAIAAVLAGWALLRGVSLALAAAGAVLPRFLI